MSMDWRAPCAEKHRRRNPLTKSHLNGKMKQIKSCSTLAAWDAWALRADGKLSRRGSSKSSSEFPDSGCTGSDFFGLPRRFSGCFGSSLTLLLAFASHVGLRG
jgi:hypothetical protein